MCFCYVHCIFFPPWATSLTLVLALLWGHSLCSQLDATALLGKRKLPVIQAYEGVSKPMCLNCEINYLSGGKRSEQKRQNKFECISNVSQNEHKLINWKSSSLYLTKKEYFGSGEPQRRARNEVWRLCTGCVSPDYGLIFLLSPTSNIMLSPNRQDASIWKGRKSNSSISYSPFQTQCA